MVKQYPYELYVLKQTEAVYDALTGAYSQSDEWVYLGKCRDEINGSGAKVINADGSSYVFSATIYAPKATELPTIGQKIKVMNGNEQRLIADVISARANQLNSRIWV